MSLFKKTFVLNALDQVGPNAKQHELLTRLLDANPEVAYYTPSTPVVNFPDANEVQQDEQRGAWHLSFTYPARAGDKNGPEGLAQLYVDIKTFVEETQSKGTLERALSSQGVISGQLNHYMSDVQIGQWLLTEALIVGVTISEEGQTSQVTEATHICISVDFSTVLR